MNETWKEYAAKASKLRDSPMVKAWIASYQAAQSAIWGANSDCPRCGFPHSSSLLCGRGATFGRVGIGHDWYYVDFSNVVFFHDFMSKMGEGWGFHWRNETFFKRAEDGGVEVRYFEQFNNSPQEKTWRIPPNEWASIVASMSAAGETAENLERCSSCPKQQGC